MCRAGWDAGSFVTSKRGWKMFLMISWKLLIPGFPELWNSIWPSVGILFYSVNCRLLSIFSFFVFIIFPWYLVDIVEPGDLDEPLDIIRVDVVVPRPLRQLVPLVHPPVASSVGDPCHRHIIFSLKKFNFLLKFRVKILFCKHYFRKGKDPEPDPYLWLMDPDPGGPTTCGSGSPTLVTSQMCEL